MPPKRRNTLPRRTPPATGAQSQALTRKLGRSQSAPLPRTGTGTGETAPGSTPDTVVPPPPPDLTLRAVQPTGADAPPPGSLTVSPPATPWVGRQPRQPARPNDKLSRLRTFLADHRWDAVPGLSEQEFADVVSMVDAGVLTKAGNTPVSKLELALAYADVVEVTGGNEVAADLAQQPVPTIGLVLDGERVERLSQQQIWDLGKAVKEQGGKVPLVFQYLVAEGTFTMTTPEFVTFVEEVGKRYDVLQAEGEVTDDSEYARIARQIFSDESHQARLNELLTTISRVQVPGSQAQAVNQFLDLHPHLRENLRKYGIKFQFGSNKAKAFGGGLFQDGVVHLAAMDAATPEVFLRLLLHELGHGTYQRLVLHNQMLSETWDKGGVIHLLVRRRVVLQALQVLPATPTTTDPSAPSGAPPARTRGGHALAPVGPELQAQIWQRQALEKELALIDKRLANADFPGLWFRLPADGKTLYQAWLVLRENRSTNLLGLDLGDEARRPANRQKYQSDTFSEFCAETFMQFAMGDLGTHITQMVDSDKTPPAVKKAWLDTARIMLKHGHPVLNLQV